MALKDIKTKIHATERTHKVTRAMEAVSAVKMRTTQETALRGRPYARAALSILTRLSGTEDIRRHPLAYHRGGKKIALVLITSDKGLAGGLNSSVIKHAVESLEGRDKKNVIIYAYGKKGKEYFARRGYTIAKFIENKSDNVPLSVMRALTKELSDGFLHSDYDKVISVYSHFKSTFEQVPTTRRLLPLSLPALKDIVEGIVPAKGKWSYEHSFKSPEVYTVEPTESDVFSLLIPQLISVALYHMMLEAKAAEHSARMVAMKNASDKSKEIAEDLTHHFNKVRQAAITREVSEIISGCEALAV